MKQIIRTAALSGILAISFFVAQADTINTKSIIPDSSRTPAEAVMKTKSSKVCSCQILSLESKNYQQRELLVFAEKTNDGKLKTDYATAQRRIEKEKRHLSQFFYDKVSKKGEMNGAFDCKTLYQQLKKNDNAIRVYDVLNADIVTRK